MNSQLVAYLTLVRKEIIRIFRIWPQTLLPAGITTFLYFIIFGTFIGSQIGLMQGFTYIQFIVPGVIMMHIITCSYVQTSTGFFMIKFQRSLEELLVSPMHSITIVAGYVTAGMVRGLLVGCIVTIVSLVFSPLVFHSFKWIVVFSVLTSALFSVAGLINGVFAKSWDDISIIPTFVLQPLIYLGGVFYSLQSLPGIWQTISHFNPIVYMVGGFRYGFLGISDVHIGYAFIMLGILLSVLVGITLYLFKKGIGIRN